MPLADMLQHAREITGNTTREQLVRYINRAAKEIYENGDLPGSVWERTFVLAAGYKYVTLPWYVGGIRGVRHRVLQESMQLVDLRPRYHSRPWRQPYSQYRIHGETPLETPLSQSATLTATLSGSAEDESVDIIITGQTSTAALTNETITIPAGSTSAISTNQFTQENPHGIRRISKSRRTASDVVITQTVGGARVAVIPNVMPFATNRLMQLTQDDQYSVNFSNPQEVDVLFKWLYIPLEEDYDQFLNTDRFDTAINWKLQSHWYASKAQGDNAEAMLGSALMADKKCTEQLQKLSADVEAEVQKKIKFGMNPFKNMTARYSSRRYRSGYYAPIY